MRSARDQTSQKEKHEGQKKFIAFKTSLCIDAGFVADSLKVKVSSTGKLSCCFLLQAEEGEPLIYIKS